MTGHAWQLVCAHCGLTIGGPDVLAHAEGWDHIECTTRVAGVTIYDQETDDE